MPSPHRRLSPSTAGGGPSENIGILIPSRKSIIRRTLTMKSISAACLPRRYVVTLRSDNPVLAELSGGMDSSAIVCVADTVLDRGARRCSAPGQPSPTITTPNPTGMSAPISPGLKKNGNVAAATSMSGPRTFSTFTGRPIALPQHRES